MLSRQRAARRAHCDEFHVDETAPQGRLTVAQDEVLGSVRRP